MNTIYVIATSIIVPLIPVFAALLATWNSGDVEEQIDQNY